MPKRLLDYIRNSDSKLLTKFEDTLGVSISLPDTPPPTVTDPNVEISVEVTGYPWCTEQVYLEFTKVLLTMIAVLRALTFYSKLLELERLASGVTWTSAASTDIRFEVKQEPMRPRLDTAHLDRAAFSDGDAPPRGQTRRQAMSDVRDWAEQRPSARQSAPLRPTTHGSRMPDNYIPAASESSRIRLPPPHDLPPASPIAPPLPPQPSGLSRTSHGYLSAPSTVIPQPPIPPIPQYMAGYTPPVPGTQRPSYSSPYSHTNFYDPARPISPPIPPPGSTPYDISSYAPLSGTSPYPPPPGTSPYLAYPGASPYLATPGASPYVQVPGSSYYSQLPAASAYAPAPPYPGYVPQYSYDPSWYHGTSWPNPASGWGVYPEPAPVAYSPRVQPRTQRYSSPPPPSYHSNRRGSSS